MCRSLLVAVLVAGCHAPAPADFRDAMVDAGFFVADGPYRGEYWWLQIQEG